MRWMSALLWTVAACAGGSPAPERGGATDVTAVDGTPGTDAGSDALGPGVADDAGADGRDGAPGLADGVASDSGTADDAGAGPADTAADDVEASDAGAFDAATPADDGAPVPDGGAPCACDDGNPCTLDTCLGDAGCSFVAISGCCADALECDDQDPCTQDQCGRDGTCVYAPIPGCPPAVCVGDADCDDGLTCTVDRCGATGVCTYVPIVCLRPAPCGKALGVCMEGAGCVFDADPACDRPCGQDADCETGDPCRPGACAAGLCHVAPLCPGSEDPCVDVLCDPAGPACLTLPDPGCHAGCATAADCPGPPSGACAVARCNDGGCVWSAVTCQDFDPCTADACLPTGCDFTPLAGCTGCTADPDCADGSACTTDRCVAGACQAVPESGCIPCIDDQGCPPGGPCLLSACTAGTCTYLALPGCEPCSTAAECDDQSSCTEDSCSSNGTCAHAPVPDCAGGGCTSSAACQDGDPCTLDRCSAGTCEHPAVDGLCPVACASAIDCADGDACTMERCDPTGVCQWTAVDCVDGAPCTVDGECDPEAGCVFTPVLGCDAPCVTDGDCRTGSQCLPGACVGGLCAVAAPCGQGDPATRITCGVDGACGAATGSPCTSDAECDAGDGCTRAVCAAGVCVLWPRECDDHQPCTEDGCDPATGCVFAPVPDCLGCADGAACDDDNVCTESVCVLATCIQLPDLGCGAPACLSDQDCVDADPCTFERCQAGICVVSRTRCADGAPCTDEHCDPVSGCQLAPRLDCAAPCTVDADCDTGSPCLPGACVGGACSVSPVVCSAEGPCSRGLCDPGTGACIQIPVPSCDFGGCATDTDCADGDACRVAACVQGACVAWARRCDDQDPCTADTCDPAAGCVFSTIAGCTGCSTDAACQTYDPCAVDVCDPASGQCHAVADPGCALCAGPTEAADCDDGDPCTIDTCDPSGACAHAPSGAAACAECTADPACDDGDPCTADHCLLPAGVCAHDPPACNDGQPCTADEPGACCTFRPVADCGGATCAKDKDCGAPQPCVTPRCVGGACTAVAAPCDDGNACTLDTCNPFSGACVHQFVPGCGVAPCQSDAACEDGDACTLDVCLDGACAAVAVVCLDADPCTTDTCASGSGCVFQPTPGCTGCSFGFQCADNDVCTSDACTGGTCTHTPQEPCP